MSTTPEQKNVTLQKPSLVGGWIKTLFDLACILLVMTVAKSAIAEPYYVPSGSMEPTLMIGDELLAAKYAYGYSTASLPLFMTLPDSKRIMGKLPSRGDVVVFRWPGDHSQIWVKRVIGLPGDRIAVHAGHVSINGAPVGLKPAGDGKAETEDGTTIPAQRFIETLPGGRAHAIFKLVAHSPYDDMSEITVPPGHLFVMGDNRDNSADSRVPLADGGVGLLPVADLVGQVDAVIGSWDLGIKNQPIWTWPSGLRLARFFTSVQ